MPQLSPDNVSSDIQQDDVFTSVASNGTTDSDWQENWLFKKSTSNAHESLINPIAHIGMLVPSPTEEVKTQIGDLTTDEVSDLSEAGSDVESELSDTEPMSIPSVLQLDSLVSQTNSTETIQEAKNDVVLLNKADNIQFVEDFNQIYLSEEEIRNSLETLDAVVKAAEQADEIVSHNEDTQVPELMSAITKPIELIEEIPSSISPIR